MCTHTHGSSMVTQEHQTNLSVQNQLITFQVEPLSAHSLVCDNANVDVVPSVHVTLACVSERVLHQVEGLLHLKVLPNRNMPRALEGLVLIRLVVEPHLVVQEWH